MPSKQTTNYQLSQWVKTDKVLMDDFNADNAAIDAAIKKVDVRVDGKADVSALNDLKQTVTSLSGTLSGHESSLNSHAGSLTKLGNCQIYTGSYSGDGKTSKTLTFPHYPVFVFLQRPTYPAHLMFIRDTQAGAGNYTGAMAISAWTDRSVSWTMENGLEAAMNTINFPYVVFALLDMSL